MSLFSSFVLVLKLTFWPLVLSFWLCRGVLNALKMLLEFSHFWIAEILEQFIACTSDKGRLCPEPQHRGKENSNANERDAEDDGDGMEDKNWFECFVDKHPALAGAGFYQNFAHKSLPEQASFGTFVNQHPALAGTGRYGAYTTSNPTLPDRDYSDPSTQEALEDRLDDLKERIDAIEEKAWAYKRALNVSEEARSQAEKSLKQEIRWRLQDIATNFSLKQELNSRHQETIERYWC